MTTFSDRFEREVRAVAALNHANICQVYDVGSNYLVMELVEGPTLADRIKQGALPLEESLAIARQIDRLCVQMAASPNTIAAYRDTFRLLLQFASERNGKPPTLAHPAGAKRRQDLVGAEPG